MFDTRTDSWRKDAGSLQLFDDSKTHINLTCFYSTSSNSRKKLKESLPLEKRNNPGVFLYFKANLTKCSVQQLHKNTPDQTKFYIWAIQGKHPPTASKLSLRVPAWVYMHGGVGVGGLTGTGRVLRRRVYHHRSPNCAKYRPTTEPEVKTGSDIASSVLARVSLVR